MSNSSDRMPPGCIVFLLACVWMLAHIQVYLWTRDIKQEVIDLRKTIESAKESDGQ